MAFPYLAYLCVEDNMWRTNFQNPLILKLSGFYFQAEETTLLLETKNTLTERILGSPQNCQEGCWVKLETWAGIQGSHKSSQGHIFSKLSLCYGTLHVTVFPVIDITQHHSTSPATATCFRNGFWEHPCPCFHHSYLNSGIGYLMGEV